MLRFFNIAGPCVPGEHYLVDPMRGINDDLMELINNKQYFLIHAARQSGKTTLQQELTRQLNAEYMDKCGSESGWLVIFDRSTEKPWEDKVYMKEEKLNGERIVVAGC